MQTVRFNQFGDPDVLILSDEPSPHCGPDDVLIDIQAASVTPGDWKLRAGLLQTVFPVTLPCIPGRDGAGVISKIGSRVTYARIGDSVCFVADRLKQGSYAEQITRDANSITPMPANLSYAQAAALVHAGMCAWIMLTEYAHLQSNQKVLVHAGAGAVGGMAIQMARHVGAYVITTCRAVNADYVRSLGAHEVITYDQEDFTRQLNNIDAVLDLVGGDVHRRSRNVIKPGGVLVWLVGQPFDSEKAGERQDIREVQALIHDSPEVLCSVAKLAAQGALLPQISQVMPLREAERAHTLIQSGKHGHGRLVLDIRGQAMSTPT